jgi:hypothetical protein
MAYIVAPSDFNQRQGEFELATKFHESSPVCHYEYIAPSLKKAQKMAATQAEYNIAIDDLVSYKSFYMAGFNNDAGKAMIRNTMPSLSDSPETGYASFSDRRPG